MDNSTEIVLEIEPDVSPANDQVADAQTAKVLPFSFAKRHGVLIREVENGIAHAVYRTGASPLSLAEARRFAGKPLKLSRVSADAFDGMLQQSYEQGSQMAMQMVGDLDEHTDLLQVAQELPEPSRKMHRMCTSNLTRTGWASGFGLMVSCRRCCRLVERSHRWLYRESRSCRNWISPKNDFRRMVVFL